MECLPHLWLREHDLTGCPTPISCQPGSCSWAELRGRSPHWFLCAWWEPCSPHGPSQGPSVPASGGPSWGQAQLGNLACWQLLGHPANWAFRTHSRIGPFGEPRKPEAHAAGINSIQKGLESLGELRARQPPNTYILPSLDPGSSCPIQLLPGNPCFSTDSVHSVEVGG